MKFHIARLPSGVMAWVDGTGTITISPRMMKGLETNPKEFWRSLLHEVAHLQAPGDVHGKMWQARATVLGASRYHEDARTVLEAMPKRGRPPIGSESAEEVRALRKQGLSWSAIAMRTGLPRTTVRRLGQNDKMISAQAEGAD